MTKQHLTTVVQKLNCDGTIIDCNEKMTLQQMQEYVGGYIETCASTIPGKTLVVDEEGAYKHRPANPNATRLVAPGTMLLPGGLTGNALLVIKATL